MNNAFILILTICVGGLLGLLFFGSLWWTVRRGLVSPYPARWFLGSMVLRISLVMAGFYFIGHGHADRLFACVIGFIIARFIVMRLPRPSSDLPITSEEDGHAS